MEEDKPIEVESISKLTDDELFKALKKYNLKAGPITGTTRLLYEKRLKNHLQPPEPEVSELQVESQVQSQTTQPPQQPTPEPIKETPTVATTFKTVEVEIVKNSDFIIPESKVEKQIEKPKIEQVNLSPKARNQQNSESFNSSPSRLNSSFSGESSNYLNSSGIRGRAPLHRNNNSPQKSETSEKSNDLKKNNASSGFSFRSLILVIIIALISYLICINYLNNTEHSVEV